MRLHGVAVFSRSRFDNTMQNMSNENWDTECPQACKLIQFEMNPKSIDVKEEGTYHFIKNNFGPNWRQYLDDESPLLAFEPDARTGRGKLLQRTALVHINFEDKYATVIMKDAKVTFPDMLGTIGGTFGVFLGASFVGILDNVIAFWRWMKSLISR